MFSSPDLTLSLSWFNAITQFDISYKHISWAKGWECPKCFLNTMDIENFESYANSSHIIYWECIKDQLIEESRSLMQLAYWIGGWESLLTLDIWCAGSAWPVTPTDAPCGHIVYSMASSKDTYCRRGQREKVSLLSAHFIGTCSVTTFTNQWSHGKHSASNSQLERKLTIIYTYSQLSILCRWGWCQINSGGEEGEESNLLISSHQRVFTLLYVCVIVYI